ncbi:MAG: hypothetical protein ACREH6_07010, partial [Geminicoccaceae bacterium]
PLWLYFATLVPSLLVVMAAAAQPWVPVADLLQDPLTVVKRVENVRPSAHYGFVSNLGVLLWCAAASVCLFVAVLLVSLGSSRREIAFMIYAGSLTLLLMLDDLLLGHEVIYRFLFSMTEKHVLAVYMIATLAYLALFWRLILRVDFEILVIGLGMFGLSALMDSDQAHPDRLGLVMEDGAKFLGITAWAAFHLRAAWQLAKWTSDESRFTSDRAAR